ncbi:MAG: hypothetical protein V1487_02390 [bacterium]
MCDRGLLRLDQLQIITLTPQLTLQSYLEQTRLPIPASQIKEIFASDEETILLLTLQARLGFAQT